MRNALFTFGLIALALAGIAIGAGGAGKLAANESSCADICGDCAAQCCAIGAECCTGGKLCCDAADCCCRAGDACCDLDATKPATAKASGNCCKHVTAAAAIMAATK